jgi:hypothetical protein
LLRTAAAADSGFILMLLWMLLLLLLLVFCVVRRCELMSQVPAAAAGAAIRWILKFRYQCCCWCKCNAHMADTGQPGICTLEPPM